MSDAVIVLAHGGHDGGGTTWLLIPLIVVGFLVWRLNRRVDDEHTRRSLGPRPQEGSAQTVDRLDEPDDRDKA